LSDLRQKQHLIPKSGDDKDFDHLRAQEHHSEKNGS